MSRAKTSGLSLVEVVIAGAMLIILMGSALTLVRSGQELFDQSVRNGVADAKACRLINRIARELTGAGVSTLLPQDLAPASSAFVSFQSVEGWVDGAPSWTSNVEIRLEYEPNELDNGFDDDADGFVDECRVMLVRDAGSPAERRVVLASQVAEFHGGELPNGIDDNGNGLDDERGLSFNVRDNLLLIRLTVLGRAPDGGEFSRILETAIGLRN